MGDKKLSTANYKGARDFYPPDMVFRSWMFDTMKRVVMSYGYEQYDGPILEFLELYSAKSGQEIVEKQLYDFTDKGGRQVAIRPEMTPTLARMVAARSRELPRPIRWFSLPNLWRYENPGHGRLREHWQLNVDIFGGNSIHAEIEIISLACDILFAFGAPRESFKVRYSHRGILSSFLKNSLGLPPEKEQAVAKILDKKNKISNEEFESSINSLLMDTGESLKKINKYLSFSPSHPETPPGLDPDALKYVRTFLARIEAIGLSDMIEFDPSIIRGFDYYTGFIFEIFDTSPQNKRSLYGGGRYDNLIGLFSNESLSGIGFGLGDVTLENFLKSHNLIPEFKKETSIFIPLLSDELFDETMKLSKEIRSLGIPCEINLEGTQKLSKQIPTASKKGYRYLLILGEEELRNGLVQFKDLLKSDQKSLKRTGLDELTRLLNI